MPHSALLFILLLLPNTTLRDWQRADAPHLHALLREGDVALMNARTAERDGITTTGACYSLGAGARMDATPNVVGLAYSVLPGNLGSSLRAHGVTVDAHGPLAQIVSNNTADSASGQISGNPTFIVVDLGGDPSHADDEIGRWTATAHNRHGTILLASPNPSDAEYQSFDQLVPVALWTQGTVPGMLYSPSTRHTGLVTNTDIVPTIAGFFHVPLIGPVYGAPVLTVPVLDRNGPALLDQADAAWTMQARAMRALPYFAGFLAVFVALISILAGRGARVETFVLLATLVPLVLLLSSTWPIAISLSISALFGAYLLRNQFRHGLTYAGALTAMVILGDALTSGGQFTGGSLLGYSPLEGARYYGIGNEAMGAVIGAGVTLTAALLPRRHGREWSALVWVVITAILAWPTAGAKAGGLLVGFVALTALFAAASQRSWRDARVWGGMIGVLALGCLGLWLLGRYGARSHLTQAVESAHQSGSRVYSSLIVRKAMMDTHLVFHSVWIWVLIGTLAGSFLLMRDRWTRLSHSSRASMMVGCAATAACLTLNDAGVVAAAVCSLSLWAVCMSERHKQPKDPIPVTQ